MQINCHRKPKQIYNHGSTLSDHCASVHFCKCACCSEVIRLLGLGRGDPPWDVGFVRPAKKGTCVCYLGPPVGRHIAELASANCLRKIYLFMIFFSNPTIFNDICLNFSCFLVRKARQIVVGHLFDVHISEEYDSSRWGRSNDVLIASVRSLWGCGCAYPCQNFPRIFLWRLHGGYTAVT